MDSFTPPKKERLRVWEQPLPDLKPDLLDLPEEDSFLFRFAVYGDNQRGIPIHRRIVEAIARSGAEVVLHVGDYVQDGRKNQQWDEQFASPARELLDNMLFLGVQGNHDRDSKRYYEIIDPPGGRSWFKASQGPVAFFGLDTNRSLGENSPQLIWLASQLKDSPQPWKVVFFHEGPYSSSWPWPGGASKTRKVVVPLLEQFGVDVVFSGHIHNYERSHRRGIPYFITGGGGDTLSKPEQLPNPYRKWSLMSHNFCTVDVYPDHLEIRARDLSGAAFDGLSVRKGQLREVELEKRRCYRGPRPKKYPDLSRGRRKKSHLGSGSGRFSP